MAVARSFDHRQATPTLDNGGRSSGACAQARWRGWRRRRDDWRGGERLRRNRRLRPAGSGSGSARVEIGREVWLGVSTQSPTRLADGGDSDAGSVGAAMAAGIGIAVRRCGRTCSEVNSPLWRQLSSRRRTVSRSSPTRAPARQCSCVPRRFHRAATPRLLFRERQDSVHVRGYVIPQTGCGMRGRDR